MKKIICFSLALMAPLYASTGHASTIYTFQGTLTQYTNGTSTALQNTFASYGVDLSLPFTFQIETDGSQPGKWIRSDGAVFYYPTYEMVGSITRQENFTSAASLKTAPFTSLPANYLPLRNEYFARNTTFSNEGLGSYSYSALLATGPISLSKNGAWGDTSIFIENWQAGDTLSLSLHYDDGSRNHSAADDFYALGSATLLSVTQVPVPAGAWLFASGIAGLAAVKRRRAA